MSEEAGRERSVKATESGRTRAKKHATLLPSRAPENCHINYLDPFDWSEGSKSNQIGPLWGESNGRTSNIHAISENCSAPFSLIATSSLSLSRARSSVCAPCVAAGAAARCVFWLSRRPSIAASQGGGLDRKIHNLNSCGSVPDIRPRVGPGGVVSSRSEATQKNLRKKAFRWPPCTLLDISFAAGATAFSARGPQAACACAPPSA